MDKVTLAPNREQEMTARDADANQADVMIPLILDLDHTLLRTDTLYESLLAYLKKNPLNVFLVARWVLMGRAALKRRLGAASDLSVEDLPFNEDVVALAREAAANNRQVIIATAADESIAQQVADRMEMSVEVRASDGINNLKGRNKAEALQAEFPQGFDYAGDSRADLPVWKAARKAILVGASSGTKRRAMAEGNVDQVLPGHSVAKALAKAMRLHQWMKNVLIFIPAVLSGKIFDMTVWPGLILTFLALGLVASATYIINDSWDICDDRRHWSKRKRPLASGDLPIAIGLAAVPVGLVLGFGLALMVNLQVVVALGIYLILTLAYSLRLKRLMIHDALVLASLFTMRLAIGTVAVQAVPSSWLFVFSMFFFLSLALAKRHTEIARVIQRGDKSINGRGYRPEDLPLVLSAGIAAGIAAVVIMVLYISEDAFRLSFSGDVEWLWGFPPLIFILVSRIWSVCQRGELDDDPVVFAVKDKQCRLVLGLAGVCFLAAWFGLPF
ncbi:MAG: UbiA family prenyltransferase [Hyphomonas sp.]